MVEVYRVIGWYGVARFDPVGSVAWEGNRTPKSWALMEDPSKYGGVYLVGQLPHNAEFVAFEGDGMTFMATNPHEDESDTEGVEYFSVDGVWFYTTRPERRESEIRRTSYPYDEIVVAATIKKVVVTKFASDAELLFARNMEEIGYVVEYPVSIVEELLSSSTDGVLEFETQYALFEDDAPKYDVCCPMQYASDLATLSKMMSKELVFD